jgi:outer membrane protein TolC
MYIRFILIFLFLKLSFVSYAINNFTLEEAIDYAIKNNDNIIKAKEEIEIAKGQKWEALGEFLPQINWYNTYTRNSKTPLGENYTSSNIKPSFVSNNVFQNNFAITQKIFSWKLLPSIDASTVNIKRTKEDLKINKNDLRRDITISFFTILYAKENVKIAKNSNEVASTTFLTTEKLYKEGKASSFDVKRAKIKWVNAQNDVLSATNILELVNENFKNNIGLKNEEINLIGNLEIKPFDLDISKLQNQALQNRPELSSLHWQKILLNKNLEVYRSNIVPNLTAGFSYIFEDTTFTFTPDYNSWAFSATLTIPIFDGLITYGHMTQIRAYIRQLQSSESLLIENIELILSLF